MYVRLPFDGTKNTRDLGGYPTKNGVIKFNELYRSDNLKHLTKLDHKMISNLSIGHIIDLRHEVERKKDPSNLPDHMNLIEISLITDLYEATSESYYKTVKLNELYLKLLTHSQSVISEILIHILNAKRPVLFHCTAGKDRTGLISMLLLGILGVGDQDIIANYEVSATYLNYRFDLYNINDENSKFLIESKASYMEKTLIDFYETFKSFENYFELIGISQELTHQFKNKMIIKKELL